MALHLLYRAHLIGPRYHTLAIGVIRIVPSVSEQTGLIWDSPEYQQLTCYLSPGYLDAAFLRILALKANQGSMLSSTQASPE